MGGGLTLKFVSKGQQYPSAQVLTCQVFARSLQARVKFLRVASGG